MCKITQSAQTGLGCLLWLADTPMSYCPGTFPGQAQRFMLQLCCSVFSGEGVVALRQCRNYSFLNFTEHP